MSPSRKFLIHYLGWVAFLFSFFYLDTNPLSHWINEVQRNTLLDALRWSLGNDRIEGIDILAHPKFRIYITQACNGLIPYYLYLAAVLAFPAAWGRRIFWAVAGYLALSAVNLLRLLFVTAMVERGGAESFAWSHDLVGNLILMVSGLGLFLLFIRSGRGARR